MSLASILAKYRAQSFSERDKGGRFERLMRAYLLTDPQYTSHLKDVWLWEDFFAREELGGQDTGIDLVAVTHGGEYWAVQCKCYDEASTIDKADVDTFLSTSSRRFQTPEGKDVFFAERLWISTTNKWSQNAENSLHGQHIPVSRISFEQLAMAPVEWDKLEIGVHGVAACTAKYSPLLHQQVALNKAHEYYKHRDRGKLIMACGTGKTFTALRIAEKEVGKSGLVLVLVPSIALLSQLLREWTAQAVNTINPICVCSDPKVSKSSEKNDFGGFTTSDLALPATTDPDRIIKEYNNFQDNKATTNQITVIFSTYQSIDVIARAQKTILENQLRLGGQDERALPEFDMIICDEAHRTTGAKLSGEDESAFIKVHSNKNIKGKKRLYMTATPRLYGEESKKKAEKNDAVLCSMDDISLYGDEIYRIGFGEAVKKGLLTDYKVLIFTVNEQDVPAAFQQAFADSSGEIKTDDMPKLIGCINALSKLVVGDGGVLKQTDPNPMKRAVAFCQTIKSSKAISSLFNNISSDYVEYIQEASEYKKTRIVGVSADHIDGSMNALTRNEKLQWLKSDSEEDKCKVLTNVRCLSEGVDVPALDAVMFLSPRGSQVEVVQSVGRVMRLAEGKKYGYIILPIFVSSDQEPDKVLDNHSAYKVVWEVLNALRAHDDRFNTTINQIDLNKNRPENILIGRSMPDDFDGEHFGEDAGTQLLMESFTALQDAIYARLVLKVGDRRYWEDWAKKVAGISERNVELIKKAVETPDKKAALNEFWADLQRNINDGIDRDEAVEMLSQHLVTEPIFDALFEGYSFAGKNPVSIAMQNVIDKIGILNSEENKADWESLSEFYDSVRERASGIDNNEGKQRVIIELYNTFFKTAFPKMAERLGIVYTPVEVVDFIIHSVNDVLKQEFGRELAAENVNILDPFTGTGTFITRLLQSGLIRRENLKRKYKSEIFANEIVLLAYYIAAVNIENAYHDALQLEEYTPFEGICLTDTFQTAEHDIAFSGDLQHNSERIQRQKDAAITVIMSNPPYSVGQKSANDNAQNQAYPLLDASIAETYAALSKATNKNALYDSYIRAFRYATDRLRDGDGVICFVSNGAWLDGNSTAGFRKSLEKEFDKIYVFNLRGNQRTSGELSRREGGKIFGSGSRTPVAITLLVKRSERNNEKAQILYRDIGDYLTQKQKLDILKGTKSFLNPEMELTILTPNEHGDWITTRNEAFDTFIPIAPERKFDVKAKSVFVVNSRGFETSRDAWVYNFSKATVHNNMRNMVEFYNSQLGAKEPNYDKQKISWTRGLLSNWKKGTQIKFEKDKTNTAIYRPFAKQFLYFGEKTIEYRNNMELYFPHKDAKNLLICASGIGGTKDSTTIITNTILDLNCLDAGTQCFPLYYYQEREEVSQMNLFAENANSDKRYIRHDGISDFIHKRTQKQYGSAVTKEDIFFYVYGFLHCPEYRQMFADDLKKSLPRILLVDNADDFWAFSKAGQELAKLHLYYEEEVPLEEVVVSGNRDDLQVQKMRFLKKDRQDVILYNDHIAIENIPAKAYEYIVNGKSAIEWVMERYQVKTDKNSGILNDPNLYGIEIGKPSYILDLLLSVISISVKSMDVVYGLPKIKFAEPDK